MIAFSRNTIEAYPLRSVEGGDEIRRQFVQLMGEFNAVFNVYRNADESLSSLNNDSFPSSSISFLCGRLFYF